MPFSDTTVKNGLIQLCEFWTSLGDGNISGDATLLKVFTARINEAFDRIMPLLLSYSDKLRWDDLNNADLPIGTVNMVSGQSDYSITADANSLNILNITDIRVLNGSTATDYQTLQRMTMDDVRAVTAMSPNSTDVGTPTHFLEMGNVVYLYPQPNYSATNGIKVFFERDPAYFASTDTTKKAGIPRPFQGLLALYASYDWLVVNKPANQMLVSRIESQINERRDALFNLISNRNPIQVGLRPAKENEDLRQGARRFPQ